MSDSNPKENPLPPLPAFRLNPRVFQIILVILLALALPLTCLIMGLREIHKNRLSMPSEPAAEVPGLRRSLENVADMNLPSPALPSASCSTVFVLPDKTSLENRLIAIEAIIIKNGATFLPPLPDENGQFRILAQIPEAALSSFENDLRSLNPSSYQRPPQDSKTSWHEIILHLE